MSDEILALALGILFGAVVITMIMAPSYQLGSSDMIEECQENLPRNENCKIVAIPEVSNE